MCGDVSPNCTQLSYPTWAKPQSQRSQSPSTESQTSPTPLLATDDRGQPLQSSHASGDTATRLRATHFGPSSREWPQSIQRPPPVRYREPESVGPGQKGGRCASPALFLPEQKKTDRRRHHCSTSEQARSRDPEKAGSENSNDLAQHHHSPSQTYHTTIRYEGDNAEYGNGAEEHSVWILVKISRTFDVGDIFLIRPWLRSTFPPSPRCSPSFSPSTPS